MTAAAWICINLFLLLAIAGLLTDDSNTPATRVWAGLGALGAFLAFNAYSLDQFGRYFGV